MPFTLSHAAAALPLRRVLRGGAVFPMLVIGCFIPDIPYFLPEPLYRINAHQLPGMVLFGIPCGWAIFALWRCWLVEPTAALLPRAYALLLLDGTSQRAFSAWWGTVSLLAGAVSHVVWDEFTHRRGLVVHFWPVLARPVWHVDGVAVPPYLLFQHGSTVLGILCLAFHVRHRLSGVLVERSIADSPPQLSVNRKLAVATVLAITVAGIVWRTFSAADAPRFSAYNFVCFCISAAAVVTVLYALAWHGYRRLLNDRARKSR